MVRTFLKEYMELGSYFVSARTNQRHHQLPPVLRHASVVSAQNWLTSELLCCRELTCVAGSSHEIILAVSTISWQRNLNLCGSPRSSSESWRPLDVISVCIRPGHAPTAPPARTRRMWLRCATAASRGVCRVFI